MTQLAARALQHDTTTGRPPTGLAQASAVWDIEAHRALLTCRTTTVLHVVSFHEAQPSHTFRSVVINAAHTGTIDTFTAERLAPALDNTARAWTEVEAKLSAPSWATEPVPRALTQAARQLLDQFEHVGLQTSDPDTQRSTLATYAVTAGLFLAYTGVRLGPNDAAALKCLYLVTRSLDPTGRGRARWVIRWKAALNAFAITFRGSINRSDH